MRLIVHIIGVIVILSFAKCNEKEPPSNYIEYKGELYALSSGIFELKEKSEQTGIAPIAIHLFHEDAFRPVNEIQFFYYDSSGKFNGTYLFEYTPVDQSFSFLKGGTGLNYDSGGEIIKGNLFRDKEETKGILNIIKNGEEFIIDMTFQLNSQDTNTYNVYYSGFLNSGIIPF